MSAISIICWHTMYQITYPNMPSCLLPCHGKMIYRFLTLFRDRLRYRRESGTFDAFTSKFRVHDPLLRRTVPYVAICRQKAHAIVNPAQKVLRTWWSVVVFSRIDLAQGSRSRISSKLCGKVEETLRRSGHLSRDLYKTGFSLSSEITTGKVSGALYLY